MWRTINTIIVYLERLKTGYTFKYDYSLILQIFKTDMNNNELMNYFMRHQRFFKKAF